MTGTTLAPSAGVLLERLANEVRWHQEQARLAGASMVQHLMAIADRLQRGRETAPNQAVFLEWANKGCGYKKRYVYYLLSWRKFVHGRAQTSEMKHQGDPELPEWVVRRLMAQARKEDGVGLPAPAADALERPRPPVDGHPLRLPRSDYRVVLADPPWQYQSWNANGTGRVADDHYPTMSLEDICALDVASVCAPDAVLLLWVTLPLLFETAPRVFEAWGFTYKTGFLVWGKVSGDGRTPSVGFGRYTRSNAELCLLATKGKGVTPQEGVAVSNLVLSARTGHSRKPLRQYDVIDQVFGREVPKAELFARGHMPGWDVWGLEAPDPVTALDFAPQEATS